MRELQRIFGNLGTYLVLVLLCVMNLALFAGFSRARAEQNAFSADRVAQETAAYLETGYHAYLQQISGQSAGQSILSSLGKQSDFIKRNRALTIRDYGALKGITLQAGADEGVKAMLDYTVTDYLLLIAPLLLIMELLTVQNSPCGAMLRSTKKGRVPLLLWRMLAVLLLSCLSVVLIWGGNIVYSTSFFGDPVWGRAVQSIPAFQHCALPVTVGEFFLLWGLMKLGAVYCITLLVWLILSVFRPVMAAVVLLPVLGGQWLLYTLQDAASGLNHLKFCNLFALLEGGFFFTDYNNLNWFGHPFAMLDSAVIALFVLLGAAAAGMILLVGVCHPVQVGETAQRLLEKLRKLCSERFGIHTVFGYEGKKLLIAQKGLPVILVTAAMTVSLYGETKLFVPRISYWDEAYEKYGGPVTEEKMEAFGEYLTYLEERVVQCESAVERSIALGLTQSTIDQETGKLQQAKEKLEFYNNVNVRMEELDAYRQKTGQAVWLMPQEGYVGLFGASATAERYSMLLLLFVIFLSAGIGAYENRFGAAPLLRSTKGGRSKRIGYQALWLALLVIPAAVCIYGSYSACIAASTPLEYGNAPVQSLDMLRDVPFAVTINGFYLLWMAARVGLMTVFSYVVAILGSRCRNPRNALLLCLVVFFLPTALAQTGIAVLEPFSVSHDLSLFLA